MTTTLDPMFGAIPDAPPPLVIRKLPPANHVIAPAKTVAPQLDTSKDDPALGMLTPEFWDLIEERASVLPRHPRETDVAYESRLRRTVTASVLLTELAESLGIPAEYARAYLRAVHNQLESLGVSLRERRLQVDGDLSSQFWSVVGRFVEPAERAAANHARGAAKRAIAEAKKKIADGDKSPAAMKALNDATIALDEAETAIKENDAMGTYLPVSRHAFAVVIDQELYK